MAHWRAALPNPLSTIDLKDGVGDFAGTLCRAPEFLDLPYDAACERFYERDSRVLTAQSLIPTRARIPNNQHWRHGAPP